jgi:hypothetical protein
MFSYRCPSCGKQHRIDSPFQQSFDAPCLRCREIIHVNSELVADAGGALAAAKAGAAVKSGKSSERIQRAAPGQPGFEYDEESAREDVDDPGAIHKGNDAEWAAQDGEKGQDRSRVGVDTDPDAKAAAAGKKKKRKPGSADEPGTAVDPTRNRRRLVTAGIVVLVVGLVGAGGYLGYDTIRKRKAAATADAGDGAAKTAAKAKTTPQSKTTASKEKTGSASKEKTASAAKDGKEKTASAGKEKSAAGADKTGTTAKVEMIEGLVKPRDDKVMRISAARLSSEVAADPEGTDAKYHAAMLEVTGIFDKMEKRETMQPPARPHALFHCEGPLILCDQLGSKTDARTWAGLRTGEPCTIRGVYGSKGVLHGANIVPTSPPADEKYRGKDLEVTGFVTQALPADQQHPFPRVVLEGETFGQTVVECLFRKTDEDKVLTLTPETPVVIHGTCGSRARMELERRYLVRLDNCELLYTTAPPADRPRIAAPVLLRAYEEDLFPFLFPPAEGGPRLEKPVTTAQLEAELAADPKNFAAKYRHKTMVVEGYMARKAGNRTAVVLTTGETNGVVAVECRFTPRAMKELEGGPKYSVQGFCYGTAGPKTLVLENCEAVDAAGKRAARRLTPDFFPHIPGRTLTYDVLLASPEGNLQAYRARVECRDGGLMESIITHTRPWKAANLHDAADRDTWTKKPGTQKVQQPGPVWHRREDNRFVLVGKSESNKAGTSDLVFEPILKLGIKPGETWSWSQANTSHEYKLVRFDTYKNQPSAIVEETVTSGKDPHHPVEISHVYVRGVGEVDRRESLRLTAKEKRLVSERRLVD